MCFIIFDDENYLLILLNEVRQSLLAEKFEWVTFQCLTKMKHQK